ncbi:hypothetical protein AHF37_03529 [Paragonimus kellicotti]|nr:hypothetical protein AHF37_03529 [Paragonimus kellicotti]
MGLCTMGFVPLILPLSLKFQTNEGSKSLGSTRAMERTVSTSLLYQLGRVRSAHINEERLLDALRKRDFPTLAEVAMRESDQLHAVCLDTWPPCLFLSAVSLAIIRWVHRLNQYCGRILLLTTTRITTGPSLLRCSFILNGKPQDKLPGRIKDVIIAAQLRARLLRPGPIPRYVCIESVNNFPTAAGLASSASGIAALAFGLAKLYGLSEDLPGLARRGSGSASRSLAGGFVRWCATGSNPLIQDNSSVIELYPASYWPTLRVLICVTNEGSKSLGSTRAMERTVSTSLLYQLGRVRSAHINEERLLDALRKRDFPTLAEVAMRESDQLHAVCLDTWPPCYFECCQFTCIRGTHRLNQYCGRILHLLNSLPRYEGGILQVISTQIGDGPQLIRTSFSVDQYEELN